jgi:RNA polymerase sigma-70 factor (ECF subfamily)
LYPSQTSSTIIVQRLLDQLKSGNPDAPQQLLDVTMDRLRSLARKILADNPAVKRWEEIDDILQNSSVRLWKALEKHHPPTPLDYFRLAAAIIRRELIDLSRRYFGPLGLGANQAKSWLQDGSQHASPIDFLTDGTNDPVKLGSWSEFHEYIEKIPEEEQMLFDLLWYQGLTLSDAAEAMGQSERTVRRRWRTARINLHRALIDEFPAAE